MDARWSVARKGPARWRRAHRRSRTVAVTAATIAASAALLLVPAVVGPAAPAGAATARSGSGDPASLVDTFVGTGSGGPIAGAIDTFPGADLPFGMIQWSPDTYPNRAEGGGYTYTTTQISGFSLTHLSGPGCSIFGTVPVLPTSGALPTDPANADEPFSHATEQASPGRYQVDVGSPATGVQLAVTTRTGIGQFTFPAGGSQGNLLFKVSGSQSFVGTSSVKVVGSDEIEGSVTSGYFCTTPTTYTLHFVATFNRPFASYGTWQSSGSSPGSSQCAGGTGVDCGAWLTFGTAPERTVTMKVGISYVSLANAAANLRAEDPGWSLARVEARATTAWSSMLGRIGVQGGARTEQQELYTALYHSLLEPSVFSDDDGQYMGIDGKVHDTHGRVQYANYSEWDIYRSEIPLLSMIDQQAVSTMMQSLVNDATQGGWLPVWEVADGDAETMNGDSADPVIADAYAFGVRGFDVKAALAAMVKGAETPGTGPDKSEERPSLTTFLSLGYVPRTTDNAYSIGETIGASETLEYAIDDFAVAQVAKALGDRSAARRMMAGAQHWQDLFNPSTGYVQARLANGAFPTGPAMQYLDQEAIALNLYQQGFAEGNAIQYTWSVPQDLAGLFALMGGDATVNRDLDTYFQQTTAGPWLPYDWSGNEPDLWTPWEYDYSGEPWKAAATVRSIATTDYSLTPDGEPGNDDLGAMSSWYVWAAIGLYPVTPGSADLAMASPEFPRVTVHLAGGRVLRETSKGTPGVYVRSARLALGSGAATALDRPWLPSSILRTGGTLDLSLSSEPDTSWGASPADAPPSYGTGAAGAVGFVEPSGTVTVVPGVTTPVTIGAQSGAARPVTLTWKASAPGGATVEPSSGRLTLGPETKGGRFGRATTTVHVSAPAAGTYDLHVAFTDPGGSGPVPPVTLVVQSGGATS